MCVVDILNCCCVLLTSLVVDVFWFEYGKWAARRGSGTPVLGSVVECGVGLGIICLYMYYMYNCYVF